MTKKEETPKPTQLPAEPKKEAKKAAPRELTAPTTPGQPTSLSDAENTKRTEDNTSKSTYTAATYDPATKEYSVGLYKGKSAQKARWASEREVEGEVPPVPEPSGPPQIMTALQPAGAPGGSAPLTVRVSGMNFSTTATVLVDGVAAPIVSRGPSGDPIDFTINPAGHAASTTSTVSVRNPDGQTSAGSNQTFSYT